MCKSTPSKETFLWEADETEFLLSSIITEKTQKVVLALNCEFSKLPIYLLKNYFGREKEHRKQKLIEKLQIKQTLQVNG